MEPNHKYLLLFVWCVFAVCSTFPNAREASAQGNTPTKDQLEHRLKRLRNDLQKGQALLAKKRREATGLERLVLRMSGAIEVLEEILADEKLANSADIKKRLAEVREEHEKGTKALKHSQAAVAEVEKAILRIRGAIKVLEEALDSSVGALGA